ncbi:DUF2254 domain-containing protein [Streptomyces sp. Je 1-4]|uniref:DUF2254 domain-containing protein n=1 Tax=Streptomyces TaxID=1883 RepID=UPI0021DB4A51|nr:MULTISPECIES: DUF2254 domain-containing protein [unclassified Streptomyces]UYB38918.1 DUF2254 domain-containing protein [Streptomyces sp. Je 1-4]UZQ34912.1 DUF2254 domain-containing protein [Streptomyces sp. Je 1-4] [Streptomyces sp. Je 1-4 4N24]UZQ42330.1 DUF2254 domain-containing protein [Streptomyces sp. Je 1-4] [Streptomyces sp. Je 1-4 4N24_ara]
MGNEGHIAHISGPRRPRALSPLREHLRDTFWFAPSAGLVGAVLLWWGASTLDLEIVALLQREKAYAAVRELVSIAEDTRTIVTTISSAMMTFIGVVFSISLVAVQMASGQLTPRVVRIFIRSRISKITLTVFLATFLFSLLVLTSYESETNVRQITSVPVVQSLLTMVLVGLSLVLFIAYVSATLRLMQVGPVVDRITRETLRMLARQGTGGEGAEDRASLAPETGRVAHAGRAGVVLDAHVARLVRVARRQGVVLRLIPRIGDFVLPGTPVLAVHGGTTPPRWALRRTVSVGVERTFHQDLGLGLRQLSDIALRALSPAVNDPTTAVQCLDRIVQILAAVVRRPLGAVHHRDRRGTVRLVQNVPGWADLVDLGLTEIRAAAVHSPQVTRRMLAGIDDLLLLAPEPRREPLVRHRTLLLQAVERAVPSAPDRRFASSPDRQGIG